MNPNPSNWKTALERANASPRCGAKTRRGTHCLSPGMPNGRCRIHGGKAGAPKGERNGNYKHGLFTQEMVAERAHFRVLLREAREFSKRFME